MSCEMAVINLTPSEYKTLATILACAPTSDGLTHGDNQPRGKSRRAHDSYFNGGAHSKRDDAMIGFYFVDVRLEDNRVAALKEWFGEGSKWKKIRRLDGVRIDSTLKALTPPNSFDEVTDYLDKCKIKFAGNKFKVELYFAY